MPQDPFKFTESEMHLYEPLLVYHILLECPVTTELFGKGGNDITACNNVRDILYNNDVTSIAKLTTNNPSCW